jgi:hypothetical protein
LLCEHERLSPGVGNKQNGIVCIEGEEMKALFSGYLNVLFSQNPKAVGGTLPDQDFYYKR